MKQFLSELIINMINKIKRNFNKIKYKIFNVFGSEDYTQFIVLTRSRTGSNMLISRLDSHPNIRAEGEIFNRLNGIDYNKKLRDIHGKQSPNIKASGFKIFYYQPLDMPESKLWDELKNNSKLKVVQLCRKNLLEVAVSRKIAGQSNVWAQTKDIKKTKNSVTFTFDELKSDFENTTGQESKGYQDFEGKIYKVYYEDLVSQTDEEMNRIFEFLKVEECKTGTLLKKQNNQTLREVIVNYDDLKDKFKGTQWENFFVD